MLLCFDMFSYFALPRKMHYCQDARSATVTPGRSVQWSRTFAALQILMSAKRCFGPASKHV